MTEIKNINNIFNLKNEQICMEIIKTCNHYNNKNQIYAYCCNKYYDCYLCHNEKSDHRINRKLIYKLKCITCKQNSQLGNKCYHCNTQYAKNGCTKCNVWCSNEEFYHCDKCGKCKAGNKDDFYHCDECNVCFSLKCKDIHNCKNFKKNDECPICLDSIFKFDKDDKIKLLLCNHMMHYSCYNNLIKNTDKEKKVPCCTLCKKSVEDFKTYTAKFDRNRENYPMPEYYSKWTTYILCNDCNVKSTIPYHCNYSKCNSCNSYNTSILNVNKQRTST